MRRDGVQIHSTHHEIVFLSHRVLDSLPDRFFMKPSAEVDKMLTAEVRPHFVGEADKIVLVDLSNDMLVSAAYRRIDSITIPALSILNLSCAVCSGRQG